MKNNNKKLRIIFFPVWIAIGLLWGFGRTNSQHKQMQIEKERAARVEKPVAEQA